MGTPRKTSQSSTTPKTSPDGSTRLFLASAEQLQDIEVPNREMEMRRNVFSNRQQIFFIIGLLSLIAFTALVAIGSADNNETIIYTGISFGILAACIMIYYYNYLLEE